MARDGENYVIDVDVVDGRGNHITASCNGPLTYKETCTKAGTSTASVPDRVENLSGI